MFYDSDNFSYESNELWALLYDIWEDRLPSSFEVEHEEDKNVSLTQAPPLNFTRQSDCLNSFSYTSSLESDRLRKEEDASDCLGIGEERLSLDLENDENSLNTSNSNINEIGSKYI